MKSFFYLFYKPFTIWKCQMKPSLCSSFCIKIYCVFFFRFKNNWKGCARIGEFSLLYVSMHRQIESSIIPSCPLLPWGPTPRSLAEHPLAPWPLFVLGPARARKVVGEARQSRPGCLRCGLMLGIGGGVPQSCVSRMRKKKRVSLRERARERARMGRK